jgi:hypothetical protein
MGDIWGPSVSTNKRELCWHVDQRLVFEEAHGLCEFVQHDCLAFVVELHATNANTL